jgi:hypothetical protein
MHFVRFTTAGFGPTLTLLISTARNDNSPFAGTWEAVMGAGPDSTIELELDGGSVRATAVEQSLRVTAGAVTGSTLSFRFRSPDGGRMITFTGRLDGDALHFTRTVETLPGGGGAGRGGIFGAQGPDTFAARKLR